MFNRAGIGFNRTAKWNRVIIRTMYPVYPVQAMPINVRTMVNLSVPVHTGLGITTSLRTRLYIVQDIMRVGG